MSTCAGADKWPDCNEDYLGCLTNCRGKGAVVCRVERKHFRHGGVSCCGDYSFCNGCDGTFYWEGLGVKPGVNPDDIPDEDYDDYLYCHCCRGA